MSTNDNRIMRARAALRAHAGGAKRAKKADLLDALTDLLTDMRHLLHEDGTTERESGVVFSVAVQRSEMHFDAEVGAKLIKEPT